MVMTVVDLFRYIFWEILDVNTDLENNKICWIKWIQIKNKIDIKRLKLERNNVKKFKKFKTTKFGIFAQS